MTTTSKHGEITPPPQVDGANPPTTFCFKLNDAGFTCDGGQVTLDFVGPAINPDSSQVADAIIASVNAVGNTLLITASRRSTQPFVRLNNDTFGSQGNQPLIDTVVDSAWVMTGMSGGTGAGCPTSTGCVTNSDCLSDNCAAPTDGGVLNACQ